MNEELHIGGERETEVNEELGGELKEFSVLQNFLLKIDVKRTQLRYLRGVARYQESFVLVDLFRIAPVEIQQEYGRYRKQIQFPD